MKKITNLQSRIIFGLDLAFELDVLVLVAGDVVQVLQKHRKSERFFGQLIGHISLRSFELANFLQSCFAIGCDCVKWKVWQKTFLEKRVSLDFKFRAKMDFPGFGISTKIKRQRTGEICVHSLDTTQLKNFGFKNADLLTKKMCDACLDRASLNYLVVIF